MSDEGPVTRDESVKSEPSKPAQNFKDLIVWQKAMVLAKHAYELTGAFPNEERFGLVSKPFAVVLSLVTNHWSLLL